MSKITVSKPAQEYFKKIIAKQKMEGLAIRLSATNVGTPGVECGILYCPKEYITMNDEHFKMDGFEIVIDSSVSLYLDESVIDLSKDDDGNDLLTFHAPNLKKQDLPEDATLFDRVKRFFETTVNPALAGHGGAAALEEVTEDGVVKVRFSGGCNGCSMVGITLKEGIQAQLNQAFPGMIKDVVDVTNHVKTDETYG
ncbi:NifU family protein [uncultured Succinatimonas sp.]|uniref:NifU family protein n=1 Tax=uncultured Succinatimonas sp. TaxID=1262973 RepID=UPI0025D48C60|nr:NifU family protein [uncultured Succinatimonas sp.]